MKTAGWSTRCAVIVMYKEMVFERPGRRRSEGFEGSNDKLLMNSLVTCLTEQSSVGRLVVPQTISRSLTVANLLSIRVVTLTPKHPYNPYSLSNLRLSMSYSESSLFCGLPGHALSAPFLRPAATPGATVSLCTSFEGEDEKGPEQFKSLEQKNLTFDQWPQPQPRMWPTVLFQWPSHGSLR
ncbi:hypothetical protein TNCV_4178561 [Trichonephila clavipes]|nr:hypothetical protein TNCV_4178561 [Trichonephila clavipes]